jgi:hypothetical protein
MGELRQGSVLAGRFEVLRPLGTGGLAEVLAARDRVTGQEVAVKLLHAHLAVEHEVAERFRREMSVTRGLNHAGIVRVFDLHEHERRPFFTMELLRGETLAERLKRGPMQGHEARSMVAEVCAALQSAHRAGVVHRDLKPHNIFLTDGGAVKLLDFGLARVAGWARLTAQSTVMGTPGYIAPELLGGSGADARADIYSLGATLYEMVMGRRAFPGSDPYVVLRKQREGAPDDADGLVKRALDPDPERRFLDAGQLLRELSGEKVPEAPPAPPSMVAGNFDVVVHHEFLGGEALRRVLMALGAQSPFAWGARLALLGKNVLAQSCSRGTAESIAAICQEQGVGAAMTPTKKRGEVRAWLARNAAKAAAAVGVVMGSGAAGLMFWTLKRIDVSTEMPLHTYRGPSLDHLLMTGWAMLAGGALMGMMAFAVAWAILGLGAQSPIERLPEGDPAVRRLMAGIARRVVRLRERSESAPAATRMLLADLIEAGDRLRDAARELADRAASFDDPLAGPEAKTLPPLAASARDAAMGRLLEMAAALDDALATAAPEGPSPSALIKKLRDETEFARTALPQLEAVRSGVDPPSDWETPGPPVHRLAAR